LARLEVAALRALGTAMGVDIPRDDLEIQREMSEAKKEEEEGKGSTWYKFKEGLGSVFGMDTNKERIKQGKEELLANKFGKGTDIGDDEFEKIKSGLTTPKFKQVGRFATPGSTRVSNMSSESIKNMENMAISLAQNIEQREGKGQDLSQEIALYQAIVEKLTSIDKKTGQQHVKRVTSHSTAPKSLHDQLNFVGPIPENN